MLARIPDDDAPARSIGPLIEAIESDPEHLEQLMWRLLSAIRRDVQPLFARFPDFFVSVNVPPVMIGDGKIVEMLQELGLVPCLDRLVCEVTERQALSAAGRAALEAARKARVRYAMTTRHRDAAWSNLRGRTSTCSRSIARSSSIAEGPTAEPPDPRHRRAGERAGARTWQRGRDRRTGIFLHAAGIDYARAGSGARRCRRRAARAIEGRLGDRRARLALLVDKVPMA